MKILNRRLSFGDSFIIQINISDHTHVAFVVERFHNAATVCRIKRHIQVVKIFFARISSQILKIYSPTANKSFFCKECYKTFSKKSGLRNHMKTHQKNDSESLTMNVVANENIKLAYFSEIYRTDEI